VLQPTPWQPSRLTFDLDCGQEPCARAAVWIFAEVPGRFGRGEVRTRVDLSDGHSRTVGWETVAGGYFVGRAAGMMRSPITFFDGDREQSFVVAMAPAATRVEIRVLAEGGDELPACELELYALEGSGGEEVPFFLESCDYDREQRRIVIEDLRPGRYMVHAFDTAIHRGEIFEVVPGQHLLVHTVVLDL
jgi:hypothetical protein